MHILKSGAKKSFTRIDLHRSDSYIRSMKTLKATFFIALLALIVVGCGGVEKILPRQDGVWKTTLSEHRSYVNSTLDSTWTDTQIFTYTFDKSGAGTFVDAAGSHIVTWSSNPKGDIVTICQNTITSQNCEQFLVLSSAKDSQNWRSQTAGAVNGSYTEHEIKLAREK
jgi:hypothetical protein